MKPALLVIDIQNAYLSSIPERDKQIALEVINWLIELFRQRGAPILRVYHTDPQRGPKPGSEAFEFPASVAIRPDDVKIVKNYPSAFKKTKLAKVLRAQGCDTLFLCGLSAVGCVLATYFGAEDRDFNTFMIKGAIMSHNSTYTHFVEDILDAVGPAAVELMVEASSH